MTETTCQPTALSSKESRKKLLEKGEPVCLIIRANLKPVGDIARFQPAGFPEIGHVIYDAPRGNLEMEKVCIVDSTASMANHLEAVCTEGASGELHPDLEGLPYVRCVTDQKRDEPTKKDKLDNVVCTSLSEGHRLASDYFLDGLTDCAWVTEERRKLKEEDEVIAAHWNGTVFREKLRKEFKIVEIAKGKTYFIMPQTWWEIYRTIFKYDPNSLIHGVLFAKEQIKISRFLTAHLEAFGASRVGRSGVKFDRLGKTTSGQPIFSVDEETAREIRATFILDLALLRSYGRDDKGLSPSQKKLLLDFALWKIGRLLGNPFRFRTGCFLVKESVTVSTESRDRICMELPAIDMSSAINDSNFGEKHVTDVYYPSERLYKGKNNDDNATPDEMPATIEGIATEE